MRRRSPCPSPPRSLQPAGLRRLLSRPARWLPLALLPLLPPLLGALLASCNGEEEASAAPPAPDAGMACERGTLGCACGESNACFDGLLCSVGRCLPTEGSRGREPEPEVRFPAPRACAGPTCDLGPASSN